MDDLISRQAAIDYCYALINAENPSDPSDEWNYSQERINQTEVILHHLEFMPSAQKKGRWRNYEGTLTCSVCETEFDNGIMEYCGDDVPAFCPKCGADMREETDEC